jgi:hypothetical protein
VLLIVATRLRRGRGDGWDDGWGDGWDDGWDTDELEDRVEGWVRKARAGKG